MPGLAMDVMVAEGPFGEFEVDMDWAGIPDCGLALPGRLADSVQDDVDKQQDDVLDEEEEERKPATTSTTGASAQLQNCKFEHGRRYHAYQDGKHAMPNDDEEIARLELQHQIWDVCLTGRLNLCPLPEPRRNVLDIGCGTGAWAIDFAKAHPSSRVIGMDLSSIQLSVIPLNVEFLVGDFTAPWNFGQKFDYVHSRAITIGVRDWEQLVDNVWRNLEPGGWVEFQEYHLPWTSDDGSTEKCAKFEQWNQEIFRAAKKAGTKPDAILQVPELLEKRGFLNAKTASTKWPIGPWAKGAREKRVGELYLRDLASALEGFSTRLLTKVLGWSHDEMTELVKQVAVELHSGKMHAYLPMDIVWAQKPMDAGIE